MTGDRPRVGFACSWWNPRATTWSLIPGSLSEALSRRPIDLVSIEAQRPVAGKVALRVLHTGRATPWKYGRLNRALTARRIRRQARSRGCDVVVSIADDTMPAGVPTFVYQDMNFDVAAAYFDQPQGRFGVSTIATTHRVLRRLAEQQRRNYDALEGVFVFGSWFRDWLVDRQGLAPERVHVVGAGMHHLPSADRPPARRGRLLFMGGDFERKGGDVVLAAVDLLRHRGHDVTLTVAGPARWPGAGPPPAWVDFAGYVGGARASSLWSDHDLLVVPSRFEAYGMVFSEALAAGRPCVGRRAFAMPELIGDGGRLLSPEGDAGELADTVADALADDALYARVWARRETIRRQRSWDAVAARMTAMLVATASSPR
ncbi:MAG: glycosyltransferase family 4 protein [Acidimicrobiia bacterium]|nr:glycosyltransferase family 4 protein [Acidimicrobiia bacterium]